jgi:hypothetical protein
MAIKFTRVQPGDLITASFMNAILDQIEALDAKIGAPSTTPSTTVTITGLITASTPARVGDELKVVGTGFGSPAGCVVTIDGVHVSGSQNPSPFKAGSGDTMLIFNIPAVPALPSSGKVVSLVVSNANGAATTTFALFPFQATIPAGRLFVFLSASPPSPLTVGNTAATFDFTFSINADTNMDENYLLSSAMDLPGWTASTLDPLNNTPLAVIPIGKGQTKTVKVRVGIPGNPGNVTGKLTLSVTSQNNPTGLNKTVETPIPANGQAPPPQDKVIVNAAQGMPQILEVPPDNTTLGEADFSVLIKNVGNNQSYTITPTFANAAGWTVAGMFPTSPFTVNVPANGQADVALAINLKASGAATLTDLIVKITKSNDNTITGQTTQKIRPKP